MSLLDWIYPPRCMACRMIFEPVHNQERFWLCINCKPLLITVPEPICQICGHPADGLCPSCKPGQFEFKSHRAVFTYEGVVQDLIRNIKFRSERQAAQGLGHMMAEAAKSWDIEGDYIVPVPLHPSKKRSRGFNQAEVLARPISKALGIPMATDMIKRIKKTLPQSALHPQERENNLKDAFIWGSKKYDKPGRIILVDDIFTSGATMNTCTRLIMGNNPEYVIGISLSIALKNIANDT